jgi:hypothetical protein
MISRARLHEGAHNAAAGQGQSNFFRARLPCLLGILRVLRVFAFFAGYRGSNPQRCMISATGITANAPSAAIPSTVPIVSIMV